MIDLIYGAKGSGKTKKIIEKANEEGKKEDGIVVFITDTSKNTLDVDKRVRFVDVSEYGLTNEAKFVGFIMGMIAANSDINYIFIDGINRFLLKVEQMAEFYDVLETISNNLDVNFCITISTDTLPEFIKK